MNLAVLPPHRRLRSVRLPRLLQPRPLPKPAPVEVPSPLMGRVVGIDVKPGQDVTHGQQLLTIETMKMNTFVLAPKAGKVTEVLITVGDAVEEGRLLVRIA